MLTIIVADIFGKTRALERFIQCTQKSAAIFDPYDGKDMDFSSESEAYAYFITHVGLDVYAKRLKAFVESTDDGIQLIGFSIGASAIWQISGCERLNHVTSAFCFYGSQIRKHSYVKPQFPIELIFPLQEKHFSIEELIVQLANKSKVNIQRRPYLHGFMNEKSENFDAFGYKKELEILCSSLL